MAFVPYWKREKPQPAPPLRRDRHDHLALVVAIVGVICSAVGSVIAVAAFLLAVESGKENARVTRDAIERIADLAEQASKVAETQSAQLQEMRVQSGSLANQAKTLSDANNIADDRAQIEAREADERARSRLGVSIVQNSDAAGAAFIVLEVRNEGGEGVYIQQISAVERVMGFSNRPKSGGFDATTDITSEVYSSLPRSFFGRDGTLSSCLAQREIWLKAGEAQSFRCSLPNGVGPKSSSRWSAQFEVVLSIEHWRGIDGHGWASRVAFVGNTDNEGPWKQLAPSHKKISGPPPKIAAAGFLRF